MKFELVEQWKQLEIEGLFEYCKGQQEILRDKSLNLEQRMQRINMSVYPYLRYDDSMLLKKCESLTDEHFEKLQLKVVKKIGEIKEIQPIGGPYDFIFIGETGKCKVKVVLAGGWNIQRAHTRWTLSKVK